jgi:hypothetical protein
MLGVLMAAAGEGQSRPARGDLADIVKGALICRLRGPRGGWAPALAVFALLAPLFLVLTDLLQVAFPYWQSKAGVVVAAAVVAGRRRTALWILVVAMAADLARYNDLVPSMGGQGLYSVTLPHTVVLVTITVFLLEAVALSIAEPRAARRLDLLHSGPPARIPR